MKAVRVSPYTVQAGVETWDVRHSVTSVLMGRIVSTDYGHCAEAYRHNNGKIDKTAHPGEFDTFEEALQWIDEIYALWNS